jgi:hypothetical protein
MANFLSGVDPKWLKFGGEALQDLGYGLVNSPTLGGAFGAATRRMAEVQPYRDAYATQQKAEAERQAQINQTAQWLQTNYPQYASLPPDQGFKLAMQDLSAKQSAAGSAADPASVREWEYFSKLPPEQQGAYLRMKRSVPYLDVGTGFVQPDPVNPGAPGGPEIVKDNYTPAYDAGAGAAQAKVDVANEDAYASLASKMPGLKQVVNELGVLAEKATYTSAGKLWDDVLRETGQMPSEGALARTKYMAMVDNQILPLLRDTFGAQFTVQEGETLRATLGAPDKTPAEKKAVLEAFIEQKVRDVQALQSRVPGNSGGGAANDPLGIR